MTLRIFGFLLFALIISIPFHGVAGASWYWGRKRVKWFKWEFGIFAYALFAWWLLMFIDSSDKSMANAAGEPIMISIMVSLTPLGRLVFPGHSDEGRRTSAQFFIFAALLIAFCVWKFTDSMPA